jgi:transposase
MEWTAPTDEIRRLEHPLMAWHRAQEISWRLETIPGLGIITATALPVNVPDPAIFGSGRQIAAFLGRVPRQTSLGGSGGLGLI